MDASGQFSAGLEPNSLQNRKAAINHLLSGSKGISNNDQNELLSLAQKRSQDTLKFSHFLLKNRLVDDLDHTIDSHLNRHPEMRGKYYVGILVDVENRVEVVPFDEAVKKVEGLSEEEAREVLSKNPVGYYKEENFTLKTPSDEKYREFQAALDDYFVRNKELINYLRQHPESDVDASDLYSKPGS